MIIKEITIENFRSYYGVNTIKFNDGLMIFIGDNGDGKTTFFEALEWLFDTSKQNLDSRLISEKKIAELPEFENDTLRVSMTFDHDGEKIVEKSFVFTKNADNEIKTSDFQFKGYQNEGSERTPIQGGVLLDRCFEVAIRKYCLFKGEENLNVFNNPDALNYLIETFSNIRQFEPYYTGEDDNQGFTDYAEYQSRKAFEKAMKSDKQNSQQERELSSKLDLSRKNLSDVRQRLRSNRENATNYSTKLNEIENSKEASELLKAINERLKSLRDKKNNIENRINEDYSIRLLDDMWILCGYSSIFEEFQQKVSAFSKVKRKLEREEDKFKGKQELAKEIAEGIIPLSPNIPDKISMQEMIKDEFCKVCGRDAKEGTDAYDFMVNKLNDLIKSQQPQEKEDEKPLFPNNFLKELEQKSNNLEYNQSDINSLINTIRDDIEFNEGRKSEANKIQESIDIEEENKKKLLAQNDGLTEEQLQNAYENIKNWWDYKNQAEKQIVVLEKEEVELEKELEKYQEQYENLAKDSVAATYSKIHNALDKVKNAFKNAKEKNTRDFLTLLEDKANQYLERLNIDGFYGIIRIIKTPDGTARIALQDRNDTFISSPNQALKTTMYMSVLFAVSDLTALKRENDYPLIFDAPTSSFSTQKESDFFGVIANISKQCIIFTKSFLTENGVLDNSKIDAQNCTIYRMEKQRPFNNLDLSTIQTKITLIKE
ncbi:AAA family ATPase [Flavobacterium chilense]|uniref:DNA sulfur modification protein DndD n=1 Tax=Flavobacterium chilense TaxID=946677 RepID=A0A1M6XQR2_9FLAO|nr:AAA family ATPase [Flavobacterium chilense]SHL08294.1 DNA sulfur modification protein DndD [Flavobacterium chilense]